jgi:hypothetical protein
MSLKWDTFSEVRIGDVTIPSPGPDGITRICVSDIITVRVDVGPRDVAEWHENVRKLREVAAPDPTDAA